MVPSKFHYVKNMRLRKVSKLLIAMCAILVLSVSMPSCGTMHSYWGVEHEYEFPDGVYGQGHYKPKHKKHKHKKPKKHHHRH